jgi:uncharacterized membrane protein YjjB (DUF3815 family)
MNLAQVPIVIALVASVLLLFKVPVRLFPFIALIATAVEVMRAFGVLNFKVPYVSAALLLGAAMIVGAVGSWVKSSSRGPVTAATVVAIVGAARVLTRFQ